MEATPRLTGRKLQARNRRLMQEQPLCLACAREGRTKAAEEWDHIIPLYKGGADDESNLQGLCKVHHAIKTAEDMGYIPKGSNPDGTPTIARKGW